MIPGLITEQDIEDAREDWGEGSFLWQSRILGIFPDKVEDTLISLSWVEAAANQDFEPEGPVEVACDVARYGSDSTVFGARPCLSRRGAHAAPRWRRLEIMTSCAGTMQGRRLMLSVSGRVFTIG